MRTTPIRNQLQFNFKYFTGNLFTKGPFEEGIDYLNPHSTISSKHMHSSPGQTRPVNIPSGSP